MIKAISFFACMLLFLSGCNGTDKTSKVNKPVNVPNAAFWVGGADGGVFVDMEKENLDFSGSIFAEVTGAVLYQGKFTYTGKTEFEYKKPSSYSGWDGQTLYLKNGGKLVSQ
jgi:hypothetical protein